MADPLSVAGLAAGVVSLGIQLCGGVVSYLDGLDAREHELQAARRQIDEVGNLFEIIQAHTDCLENSHARASRAARSCAETCKEQINGLDELVRKLTGSSRSGSTSLRQKVQDKGKKLMYPFHRPDLEAVESRLDKLNGTLQVALQVLDLGMTSSIEQKVTDMHAFISGLNGSGMRISVVQRPLTAGVVPHGLQSDSSLTNAPQTSTAAIAPYHGAENLNIGPSRCYCTAKRSWSLCVKRWGYWNVFHENTSSEPHVPGCKFRKGAIPKQTAEVGLEYTGLVGMINTAFRLSLFAMNETRGYNIGPRLTCYPAVDERTAPVFKILDMVSSFFLNASFQMFLVKKRTERELLLVQESIDLVELCVAEITSLYRTKRASPRVSDSRGRTAMHALVQMLRSAQVLAMYHSHDYLERRKVENAMDQLCQIAISDFIGCHVPAMQHDRRGESPAAMVMKAWSYIIEYSTIQRIVSTFISADQESLPISLRTQVPDQSISHQNLYHSKKLFQQMAELAEACGCGPLIIAVCNSDTATITKLLTRDSSCLHETNIFGQTALHLPVNDAHVQELLTCHRLSLPVDARDLGAGTALDYALRCNDIEYAQTLIELGCPIDKSLWWLHDYEPVAELLLRGIKERRDQLKRLGVQHLLASEAERMGLFDPKTLDYQATKVQMKLERLGVEIPGGLKVICGEDAMYSQNYRFPSLTESQRQSLWAYGFRDVDALSAQYPQYRHRPPILECEATECGEFFNVINWYLQHGANLSMLLPNGKGRTSPLATAHYLSAIIGTWWSGRNADPEERIRAVIRSITNSCLDLRQEDKCYCICSMGGCTPLTMLFKWICLEEIEGIYRVEVTLRPPNEISEAMSTFLTMICPEISEGDHQKALRIATFQALGVRHTCCKAVEHNLFEEGESSREEIDEINSEQAELLERLDHLLDRLSDIFYEQKNDKPLGIADPDEFWNRRWLPLVEDVCKELDSRVLTQAEIDGAEQAGINWCQPDGGGPKSDDD